MSDMGRSPLTPPERGKRVSAPAWLAGVAQKLHVGKFVGTYSEVLGIPIVGGDDPKWTTDPLCGVVIGHWVSVRKNRPRPGRPDTYMCVSACGVVSCIQPKALQTDAIKTCEACCTDGGAPKKVGSVGEAGKKTLKILWEVGVSSFIKESGNLKGDGARNWEREGRKVLTALLTDTKFSKTHGWKAFVRSAAYDRVPLKGETLRVHSDEPGQGRMTLVIRPPWGHYTFEVDLYNSRSDTRYNEWAQEVRAAVDRRLNGTAALVAEKKAEAPVPPGTNGKVASDATAAHGTDPVPFDLSKLTAIRGGLDRMMEVGKGLNEVAAMKGPAWAALKSAQEKHAEALGAAKQAEENRQVAKDRKGIFENRVADYERKLQNSRADLDTAETELLTAQVAEQKALDLHKAAETELKRAAEALKELEALEAEEMKKAGDAKNLAVLLEALGRIGGP